ncbi:2Fe-2S iron-sulfur cluster-binding protein [Marinobacterium jannaschii]|uniref:2Fe-2S iron-sulfur cluster-binding protein n=1 Tax=Marinobacterium jannaschii TaxID=64970 RepID=UPI000A03313C|nr:2Fe-2S iron-sulfur cluster-binding protein [Marinobacterium jannaschii]
MKTANDNERYPISVINRDSRFVCDESQTLLGGMEAQALAVIRVGCRGGGCGMCKIRILDGAFESKRMSRAHISEAEAAEGYALACRVFPRSPMLIESDHFSATAPDNNHNSDNHEVRPGNAATGCDEMNQTQNKNSQGTML